MSDDSSPNSFEEFLKKKGWKYERLGPTSGKITFILHDYLVTQGQNAGKKIQIGLPIPEDYPSTAPYGIHVKSNHGLIGNIPNFGGSYLGNEWQFWSRNISNWSIGRRNARTYLDNVNRWLELP